MKTREMDIMRSCIMICAAIISMATLAHAHEAKNTPVTIDTIDSDTLVSQVWNPNPSPVEAIVLKRRQRAKK
jgi:hypothetical protein